VTDSSGQIDWRLRNGAVQRGYARLSPQAPGSGSGYAPRLGNGQHFADPRLPPTDSTRVRGFVVDGRGEHLEGIAIQIRPAFNRDYWTSVSTDGSGEFELVEPPGPYVIYAHASGFIDSDESVVKQAYRDSTLTIQLQREAPQAAPSFDCSQAAAPVELAICQDGTLAAAERAMTSAFQAALGGRMGTDRANLRGAQQQWYGDYVATCNALQGDELKQCVLGFLTRRTDQLRVLR
jgi:hypothetical protein